MQKITEKQLIAIVDRISRVTKTPSNGSGSFQLSMAYGGYCLHRIHENGGVTDVFRCGHVKKRELAERMWAFIDGLEFKK